MNEPVVTERLILRLPVESDRPPLYEMWADPAVMADLGPVKDDAASDAALARHDGYRGEGLGFRVVERREDGAIIGFCGLKRGDPYNPIAGEVEAGWMIAQPYWRRGYALEAMVAMLDWGWTHTDAERVVAITSARNAKSQQMMLRLGMARLPDGDFNSVLFEEGNPLRALVTYAITRP